jgi:hypothetical protein
MVICRNSERRLAGARNIGLGYSKEEMSPIWDLNLKAPIKAAATTSQLKGALAVECPANAGFPSERGSRPARDYRTC